MHAPNNLFPFHSVLSFGRLIKFWQDQGLQDNTPTASLARSILEMLELTPAFMAPIEDLSVLDEHEELLHLMMSAVFPIAMMDCTVGAAFVPFQTTSFFSTDAFRQLDLLQHASRMTVIDEEIDHKMMYHGKAMNAYHQLLTEHYGVETRFEYPIIFSAEDPQTGLSRHYKIILDPTFVEIKKRGPLKALSAEDIRQLLDEPMNLELWTELLPPDNFDFQGFMVMTAVDVTSQQIISMLKNDLLQKDAMTSGEKMDQLQSHLQGLLRNPNLQLGLLCLETDDFDAISSARPVGRSLLMSSHHLPECSTQNRSYYARVFETREPVLVSDLEHATRCTGFEQHLCALGMRTLLLLPLFYEGQIIGLLELGSPIVGDIHALNSMKLMEVVSLFATAMQRSMEEQEDRVQALIKRQYTAIHPVVEWRFRQAALHVMEAISDKKPADFESIVFHDVYPLYGLSDIRSSSTHRNDSIQADLVEQLGMALTVVEEAGTVKPMPALDELGFRLSKYIEEIVSGLRSGDEATLLDFLHREVEPLFVQLASFGPGVDKKIRRYREALDPELGILYRERKDFENTVQLINDTVGAFVDREEEKAQLMFPHYFEKYKTDGVDYNIYIGSALQENGEFDLIYLRNMRLWQLMTTAGVVWEMEKLKARLPMQLDTAHLILVQSTPLSIRFREDEKQFDVDGAYNIRYEIVKKRIDKARVKGTNERLTQPGKIAIVYSQTKEEREYRQYIEYMQAAGYLTEEVEYLELEDLQGVTGLLALRVTAAPKAPPSQVFLVSESNKTHAKEQVSMEN